MPSDRQLILFPSPSSSDLFFGMTIRLIMTALFTCLLIKSLTELVDWWGYLQPSLENGLLSLKTNVFGPTYKSAQIPLGLNVLSDSKVTWALFKQRVNYPLLFWLLNGKWSSCYLLALLLTLYCNKNKSCKNDFKCINTLKHYKNYGGSLI